MYGFIDYNIYMITNRKVEKIITGVDAVDGAGVKLTRVFGLRETKEFDPFLMMDAFDSTDPADYEKGFPWHPHRGIETITYLIEGSIEHSDSIGSQGLINGGDAQWMTAGSGIIHQEMPLPTGRMRGVQIWLNLPKAHKMSKPKYGDILSHDIPEVKQTSGRVRVISGTYQDTPGAFNAKYVEPLFVDVSLEGSIDWEIKLDYSDTAYLYIFEGSITISDGHEVHAKQAALFSYGKGLKIKSGRNGTRFILLSAPAIKEPIAWAGPIVMNTEAELHEAFAELEARTFIK